MSDASINAGTGAGREDAGRLVPGALMALTAIVYANGLTGGFLYDDPFLAQYAWNRVPIDKWGWGQPNPLGHAAQRPLVTAIFYIDALLWGKNVVGYHAFNLAIHLLNVGLAWAICRKLGLSVRSAAIASLVFAIHPVQTESVTYISGRRDVLYGAFFLGALFLYVKGRERPDRRNSLAVWMTVVFGLGAKEATAVLPGIFVALEASAARYPWSQLAPASRGALETARNLWEGFRGRWLLHAGILAVAVPWVLHRALFSTHAHTGTVSRLFGGTVITHALSAAKAQVLLLWRLVCPVTLIGDYTGNTHVHATGPGDPMGWAAVGLLIVLVIVLLWVLVKRPWAGFAGMIIALGLLPTSQIIPHSELVTEHYLYIPVFGFGLLLARTDLALTNLDREKASRVGTAALILLATFYVGRTWARNTVYESDLTFWRDTASKVPENARALVNLGLRERINGGSAEQALERYLKATRTNPYLPEPWANAAGELLYLGRAQEAIAYARRGHELQPDSIQMHVNVVRVLLAAGRPEEAWEELAKIARRDPFNRDAQALQGKVLQALALRNDRKSKPGPGAESPGRPGSESHGR